MNNMMLFIFLLISIYILKINIDPNLEFMENVEYEKYREPYTSKQRFDKGGFINKIWYGDAMNTGSETVGENRFYNMDNYKHYYWQGDYKYYEPAPLEWIHMD